MNTFSIGQQVTVTVGADVGRGRHLRYCKGDTLAGTIHYIDRSGNISILLSSGGIYLPGTEDTVVAA